MNIIQLYFMSDFESNKKRSNKAEKKMTKDSILDLFWA